MVDNFAFLFNGMPVGRGSDFMIAPKIKLTIYLVRAGHLSVSWPIWDQFAPVFQWCC